MDVLEFLAWDNINKSMHRVEEISFPKDAPLHGVLSGGQGRVYFNLNTIIDGNREHVILRQFTFQRDNSMAKEFPDGRKIYDGDIVRATNKGGWSRLFEIMWNEDVSAFKVWAGDQPNISFNLTSDNIIDFNVVVVGNKFENPELLGL